MYKRQVLDHVESRESGLTSEQVERSRENCGWNELAEGKKKSILQIFFEQYKDFLVLILIASAVISGMLGDVESAAVIAVSYTHLYDSGVLSFHYCVLYTI